MRHLSDRLTAQLRRSRIALYSVMLPVLAFSLVGAAQSFLRIAYIVLGFSLIIFLHELGHFVVARACSVKCLAFSLGIGPRMLGWRKGGGLSFGADPYDPDESAKAARKKAKNADAQDAHHTRLEHAELATTHSDLPTSAEIPPHPKSVGDCDYRLSWLPLGGYVRMLGQDDMDPTKISNDPRAFNRRPIWQRMCIVSAGVIMNIIFAAVAFSIIFSQGIGVDFPPAVIGGVLYGSPAAKAGLQMGDRVVAIDGHRPTGFVEFTDLQIAAALYRPGSGPITFTITRQKPDGTTETLTKEITPEGPPGGAKGFWTIGVTQMPGLNIVRNQDQLDEEIKDRRKTSPEEAAEIAKLRPRDRITAVNDAPVADYLQFYRLMQANGSKPMKLTVAGADGSARHVTLAPQVMPVPGLIAGGITTLGIGPQLMIKTVHAGGAGDRGGLKDKDLVLRVGDRSNPSPEQASDIIRSRPGSALPVVVERDGKPLTLEVTPADVRGTGFLNVEWDLGEGTPVRVTLRDPDSPAGKSDLFAKDAAVEIAAVDGKPVKHWLDVVDAIRGKKAGDTVALAVKAPAATDTRTVTLPVDADALAAATAQTEYKLDVPVELATELQHGQNAWQAVVMGAEHTQKFIEQVYLTLRGLFIGTVSADNLHGIVGITKVGYDVQERGPVWLWYVLAMVSVNLAVANFLPLPIVDGGLFLLLILEKIRGEPLPLKVQSAIQVVGIVLLAGLFLFVTWNDLSLFTK